jgi:hypothetical protein
MIATATVSHKRLTSFCPSSPWGVAGWTVSEDVREVGAKGTSATRGARAVITMNPRPHETHKGPCVVRTLGELQQFLRDSGIELREEFITSQSDIFAKLTPTVAALLPDMEKIFHSAGPCEALDVAQAAK